MDLFEAQRQARLLMTAHGLTDKGWRFEWDNAARRFGQCRYNTRVISMSKQLTVQRDIDSIRNTMLHEIAHAIVRYEAGHGPIWRAKAISIGSDGRRCSTDEIEIDYKYIAKCPNGHLGGKFLRKPRTITLKSCSQCSSVYNPNYAFRVVAI